MDDADWGFLRLTVTASTVKGEFVTVSQSGGATATQDSFTLDLTTHLLRSGGSWPVRAPVAPGPVKPGPVKPKPKPQGPNPSQPNRSQGQSNLDPPDRGRARRSATAKAPNCVENHVALAHCMRGAVAQTWRAGRQAVADGPGLRRHPAHLHRPNRRWARRKGIIATAPNSRGRQDGATARGLSATLKRAKGTRCSFP